MFVVALDEFFGRCVEEVTLPWRTGWVDAGGIGGWVSCWVAGKVVWFPSWPGVRVAWWDRIAVARYMVMVLLDLFVLVAGKGEGAW